MTEQKKKIPKWAVTSIIISGIIMVGLLGGMTFLLYKHYKPVVVVYPVTHVEAFELIYSKYNTVTYETTETNESLLINVNATDYKTFQPWFKLEIYFDFDFESLGSVEMLNYTMRYNVGMRDINITNTFYSCYFGNYLTLELLLFWS